QDVRLEEVTSDRTLSNQSTALRGQFLVPNTESLTRWRYVPLTDAAGNPETLQLGGIQTLRLTANQPRTDGVISVLQLNWILFVPTAAQASTGPWIASAYPTREASNFYPDATMNFVILNRGTSVSCPGGIQLWVDGINVTSSATISCTTSEGSGAMVSYRPSAILLPRTVHAVGLVFGDGSTTSSNQWNFTVADELPLLSPSDAVGGLPDALFTVQVN